MTTTTETKKAKAPEKKWSGKRAILWNPQDDYREAGVPVVNGYENVRPYAYIYVDEEETQLAYVATKATLSADRTANVTGDVPSGAVFAEFRLFPGLNWVSAKAWEAVKLASTSRRDADIASGIPNAVDEIDELVRSRAITVFEPSSVVAESKAFEGRLEDYDPRTLKGLFSKMDDVTSVENFLKDAQTAEVRAVVKERLDQLNQTY